MGNPRTREIIAVISDDKLVVLATLLLLVLALLYP